jgi:phosphatidylglycerol---prolipoprotein diacylglyceryl transferase
VARFCRATSLAGNGLDVHPLLIQLGPIAVPSYGVFAAIGVLAGLFLSVRVARARGVDPDRVWTLGILIVISSLLGSRLLLVTLNWSDFRTAPLWMVGLAAMHSQWLLLGGCILGSLTGFVYALIVKLPLLRTLDVLAPSLALGHAILCIGAFWAGSSWGTPTSLPWAVIYNSKLSALWSGTPQGVPLHPTQLYKSATELVIFSVLMLLLPRLKPGEVMGLWLFLAGISIFLLDFLRGGGHVEFRSIEFTMGQAASLLMVVSGGVLWWKRDTVETSAQTS